MAKIADLLASGRTFSFEFFPPKTDQAVVQLEQTLIELESLGPSFVSVTYGAGGTTRERTHDIVVHINNDTTMTAMAHLTCAAHSRADLADVVTRYREAGIENILALGGDPPRDWDDPPPTELAHATDLVALVRDIGDFSVGVAAHPEGHPKSPDLDSDRHWTAEKLRGADFAITQFFFDNDDYYRLVDDVAALGVDKPIVPGIMPVTNARSIQRMAEMSGAQFPAALAERIMAVEDDPAAVERIGVEVSTTMCEDLLANGVPGLHFYTLNRSPATREIYANLGLART
ncbi:MAG TPA: methylenetetrahydrofolate reductase [NAD(P)H] [Acidimicrobiia bacterium]|nr:methylenetetrahydrofolate reductase [NAD(P)H] [Acidimicrobiia bacterium]